VITGIVVALSEELNTLTRFAGEYKITKGSLAFLTERLVVAYAGAGPRNARSAAELLVDNGATRLISWGCAAALSETLRAGDLVLADTLIDADSQRIDLTSEWHSHASRQLLQHFTVHSGGLAESKTIVSASEDKKQLRTKTKAIALDMESVAIAKVAGQNKLPFLVIRAIADPVSMSLPAAINYALNDRGDVVLGKLLLHLALHPRQLPGLIKLGLYFHAAKNTLKQVAMHLDSVLDVDGYYHQQQV